ncbi:spore germination protein, partial [Bacillus licheniformis]
MPAIVGPIKINEISGGVVNFGDSFYLSPKSTSKSA